jgi:hypothetical protein
VEQPEGAVDGGDAGHVPRGDPQQVADEHVLDVLRPVRRVLHQQDGERRRDGVGDADDRLLGHPVHQPPGEREQQRPHEGEAEGDRVGLAAVGVVAVHEGHRGPEGRDLREGDVDEDHPPGEHVDAQVGVDAHQDQAREERYREKVEDGHGLPPNDFDSSPVMRSSRSR